tara:strand:- start:49 stop:618 length:570 start_codon:yes stop_codon:yes gene_type:complete
MTKTNTTEAQANRIAIQKTQIEELTKLSMTSFIQHTYTNEMELYIRSSNDKAATGLGVQNDGWKMVDTMRFLRMMKMQQEIRFAEYWMPKQEDRLEQKKQWLMHWMKKHDGKSEISANNYQAAKAETQAAHQVVMFLESQLRDAQAAYEAEFGEGFSTHKGNTPTADTGADGLDAAELADLKALGIDID